MLLVRLTDYLRYQQHPLPMLTLRDGTSYLVHNQGEVEQRLVDLNVWHSAGEVM